MFRRLANSISIAVQVATLGFEESFKNRGTKESILGLQDPLTEIPNRKAREISI